MQQTRQTLSLASFDEGAEFEGPDAVFPEGYDRIAHALASSLDIRTGAEVKDIQYSGKGVSIHALNQTFKSDFAIVTVPLGVLKKGLISFGPALPDRKLRAIDQLGMGLLSKTYLTFEEEFPGLEALNYYRISNRPREHAYWINLRSAARKPVLGALNAGTFGLECESLSPQDREAAVFQAARTLFGDDMPRLKASVSSYWSKDPFAAGSYSYLPMGTEPSAEGRWQLPF